MTMEEPLTHAVSQLLHRPTWPAPTWCQEEYAEFEARYEGFGYLFFATLNEAHPHIFDAMRFYRNTRWQTQDAFAVCVTPDPFAVQLDPDCEVICLWNTHEWVEIGAWSATYERDAMEWVVDFFGVLI